MISASGVRKIISIPRENKIIFLIPYADMFPCFKQKHTFFFLQKTRFIILCHIVSCINKTRQTY